MHGLVKRGLQIQGWSKYMIKNCSAASTLPPKSNSSTYEKLINSRQQEAIRSIIVQVNSEHSFDELCNYCMQYGKIVGAHHFSIQNEDEQHYILMEFSSQAEAAAAIDSSSYNQDLSGVPVRSPFLWFKAARGKHTLKSSKEKKKNISLNITNGTKTLCDIDLNNMLNASANIDEQIRILYEKTKLNDLGTRMRFLAALQVQQAVSGMFPEANAKPFGSSVNGFGKMGCDLDLILRFDREVIGSDHQTRNMESRLVFHTKENLTNGRSHTQRQMETLGDVLQLFLPGVCHVRRILQARVPIIKYHHEHLNLEVDLSMSNLSGFYMSELLYMFGKIDDRVQPLTFCIRRWANACGLTNPAPGRWITNFSLTCLVIFFLQQLKNPVLPTINSLVKYAKPEDIRVTEDGINCTFARNIENLNFKSENPSRISELLLQFFEFYSQFDFNNRAMSLNDGRTIAKPDHSALYIVNPLEQVLNVSKNVSMEECERLRIEVRNAAWLLESDMENSERIEDYKSENGWGLANIFKTPEKSIIRPNMFFKTRLVEVSDLFERSPNDLDNQSVADPMKNIEFKNPSVQREIQNIKASVRNDLKNIRLNSSSSLSNAASSTKSRRNR